MSQTAIVTDYRDIYTVFGRQAGVAAAFCLISRRTYRLLCSLKSEQSDSESKGQLELDFRVDIRRNEPDLRLGVEAEGVEGLPGLDVDRGKLKLEDYCAQDDPGNFCGLVGYWVGLLDRIVQENITEVRADCEVQREPGPVGSEQGIERQRKDVRKQLSANEVPGQACLDPRSDLVRSNAEVGLKFDCLVEEGKAEPCLPVGQSPKIQVEIHSLDELRYRIPGLVAGAETDFQTFKAEVIRRCSLEQHARVQK